MKIKELPPSSWRQADVHRTSAFDGSNLSVPVSAKKENAHRKVCILFWRYRPDLNWRITVLQTGALPLGYGPIWKSGTRGYVPDLWSGRRGSNSLPPPWQGGALPDELRPQIWCLRSESNQRHADFQSAALPTELQRQMRKGDFPQCANLRLYGDPERTRTVDLQRDRLAC